MKTRTLPWQMLGHVMRWLVDTDYMTCHDSPLATEWGPSLYQWTGQEVVSGLYAICRSRVVYGASQVKTTDVLLSAVVHFSPAADVDIPNDFLYLVRGSNFLINQAGYGIAGGNTDHYSSGLSLEGLVAHQDYTDIIEPIGLAEIANYAGHPVPFGLRTHKDIEAIAPDGAETILLYNTWIVLTYIPIPEMTTQAATGVSGTEADLNGLLTDGGGETCTCGFQWGETPALGNTTPTSSQVEGQTFSQHLSGLTPVKTYYYRAFATDSVGTGYGAIKSFTTAGGGTVQTMSAWAVTYNSATLRGKVDDDGGEPGDVWFEWGKTIAYGNETAHQAGFATGNEFYQDISGLDPTTNYHYRAVFHNSAGTVYGDDVLFQTLMGPGARGSVVSILIAGGWI